MPRPLESQRIRLIFAFICTVGIVVWLLVGLVYPGTFRKELNLGHRLGGDVYPNIAENSLAVFRKAIAEIEHHEDYLFSECDIRETADHHLIVFHDQNLERLVPNNPVNRHALKTDRFGDVKICELTLEQVKALQLCDGQTIPTLKEILETAVQLQPKKPVLLEIKHLHSDQGRQAAIDLARRYRDQSNLEIHFLAFARNLRRSYPEPRIWLDKFNTNGFRVYQTYRPKIAKFDQCVTWPR